MAALGAGVRSIPSNIPDIALALLTGLNAATVGLIALAAFNLSKSTITDKITRFVLFASAAFGICYHAPWVRALLEHLKRDLDGLCTIFTLNIFVNARCIQP
jgi:chromate transport protein ChrA